MLVWGKEHVRTEKMTADTLRRDVSEQAKWVDTSLSGFWPP